MSIQIDLAGEFIEFERPLTRVVKRNIRITNPHDQEIAFKVKTTSPKLYCVRPNSAFIQPRESVDVQIMLQAQKEEPDLNVKCRDKFQILSTFVTEGTESDIWDKNKNDIKEVKLKCKYVQPGNADSTPESNHVAAAAAPPPPPAAAAASISVQKNTNDSVEEKMKKMEEELNKYKKQVESLREGEPVIVEKLEMKSGFPPSIYILISLMIAAIAYFINTK